ncbi:MAG TPA: hypothetical protein VI727_08095 [Candidatus Brocadiaceae bacterium]|nr:hypothetical protein [Candidatus Brocadiaceae bacterium]
MREYISEEGKIFEFYKKIYSEKTIYTEYIEIKYNRRLEKYEITHTSSWSDGSAQGHGYLVGIEELLSLQKAVRWAIKHHEGVVL